MKTIILFLILLFTCVLIRAQFEEAGQSVGIEIWKMNEECEPEKIVFEEENNPLYFRFSEENTHIVLETEINEITSESSYKIHYIIGQYVNLEIRKKTIEYIIALWKKIGFYNVTIIRQKITTKYSFLNNKTRLKIIRVLPLNFDKCRQTHLYKLSRSDGSGSTSSDGYKILNILPIPFDIKMLTNKHDFVLECDSKALIFNMSNNSNITPENNAQKLAELITKNKSAILKTIWNKRNLPPDWFLQSTFQFNESNKLFIQKISRNSRKISSHKINLKVSKFTSDEEDNSSSSFYSEDGYLLGKLNEKHAYFLQNDDIREAFMYLGNKADFENIKSALTAGEEFDVSSMYGNKYEISVVQKHTLSVQFVLAFHEVQKHFHEVELENIMQLVTEEDV